ncbi:MAG: hypothetical protein KDE24_11770, partial [Caldilinea sp.]|nr:hypothetical protein [Caldilinea sp.]
TRGNLTAVGNQDFFEHILLLEKAEEEPQRHEDSKLHKEKTQLHFFVNLSAFASSWLSFPFLHR